MIRRNFFIVKIAYIILAHKNSPQIGCLLETLQGENVSIFLHLDLLAGNKFYEEALIDFAGIKNLTFIKRFATNWGGFGLVQATLEAIRQIRQKNEFDYMILLSGQDYPIKSKEELIEFLTANLGYSFMEYYPFPHPLWKDNGGYDRINKWYFSFPMKRTWLSTKIRYGMYRLMNWLKPDRRFPEGFIPYGGAQWWCLYKDCIQYIDDFVKTHKSFVRFFRTVRIPDEIFFHTILLNSPLSKKIINRKLTYVDWNCSPGPKVLEKSDLEKLQKSNNFFARKFDLLKNPQIFTDIEKIVAHSNKEYN